MSSEAGCRIGACFKGNGRAGALGAHWGFEAWVAVWGLFQSKTSSQSKTIKVFGMCYLRHLFWGTCTRLLLVLCGAEVRAKPQSSLLLPSLFIFLGKGAVVAVLELNCKVFSCCRLSWQLVPVYVSPLWSGVWERNAQKHTLLPSFFIFLGKGAVVAVWVCKCRLFCSFGEFVALRGRLCHSIIWWMDGWSGFLWSGEKLAFFRLCNSIFCDIIFICSLSGRKCYVCGYWTF